MEHGAKPGLEQFEKNIQLHEYTWDGIVEASVCTISG